jgi:hypothetical protein
MNAFSEQVPSEQALSVRCTHRSALRPAFRLLGLVSLTALFTGTGLVHDVAAGKAARAAEEPKGKFTIQILDLEAEKGAEKNADGLTQALRRRIEQMPKYSRIDEKQSIAMLSIGLRCDIKGKDRTVCLEKMAKQLQVDRFLFGSVSKSGGQATADVHMYERGKTETNTTEKFNDSFVDGMDGSTLGKVAERITDKLLGLPTGTVKLINSEADCGYSVDGRREGNFVGKEVSFELLPGLHTVATLAPCRKFEQKVTVPVNNSITVDFSKMSAGGPATPGGSGGDSKWVRPVIGWSMIGVGAVLGGIALGAFGLPYWSRRNEIQSEVDKIDGGVYTNNGSKPTFAGKGASYCEAPPTVPPGDKAFCDAYKDLNSKIAPGVVLGAVGGALAVAGVVVLVTGPSSKEKAAVSTGSAKKPEPLLKNVQAAPMFGGGTQGVSLSGAF